MTAGEFACLVKSMRDAQKRYFRTRSPMALEESKDLEKKVDKVLEEREARMQVKQIDLFEQG